MKKKSKIENHPAKSPHKTRFLIGTLLHGIYGIWHLFTVSAGRTWAFTAW